MPDENSTTEQPSGLPITSPVEELSNPRTREEWAKLADDFFHAPEFDLGKARKWVPPAAVVITLALALVDKVLSTEGIDVAVVQAAELVREAGNDLVPKDVQFSFLLTVLEVAGGIQAAQADGSV